MECASCVLCAFVFESAIAAYAAGLKPELLITISIFYLFLVVLWVFY